MRYRVSLVAPLVTVTHETTENRADGTLAHITHVATIKGGTFTYDQAL